MRRVEDDRYLESTVSDGVNVGINIGSKKCFGAIKWGKTTGVLCGKRILSNFNKRVYRILVMPMNRYPQHDMA